jgi:hypothetical protein
MKKIPRNLAGETVSTGKHDKRCTHASEKTTSTIWVFGEEEGYIAKKNGRHVPLLVTVDEPRRNSADVRAGTDEQEYHEEERLEIEQRRLRWSSVRSQSPVDDRSYAERDAP